VKSDLTAERLRALLSYDPETGVFTRRVGRSGGRGRAKAGQVAGFVRDRSKGYICICLDCRPYRAHRLAWLYMTGAWPTAQIDHIDGVRDNNRFANLREASNAENGWNGRRHKDSTSGFKGVTRAGTAWKAQIKVSGLFIYLGRFKTPEAAHAAYVAAAQEHFGEFARSE
jgi:hypothetical protein